MSDEQCDAWKQRAERAESALAKCADLVIQMQKAGAVVPESPRLTPEDRVATASAYLTFKETANTPTETQT